MTEQAPDTDTGTTIPVQLAATTAAAVDGWAADQQISRTEATHRLIQLGLTIAPSAKPAKPVRSTRAIELAASQIGQLIDPDAPSEERNRRISRLTDGPPEFVDARVDLPKRKR